DINITDIFGLECVNVFEDRNARPLARQISAAFRADLAERDGTEPPAALQPEREAADAGKQIEQPQPISHAASRSGSAFPRPSAIAAMRRNSSSGRTTSGLRLSAFTTSAHASVSQE